MSGGSFNYLYGRRGVEIYEYSETVERMAEALHAMADDGTAGARHAAKATDALIALAALVEVAVEDLRDVWHAVEWWRSGDWSREQAVAELAKWTERHR